MQSTQRGRVFRSNCWHAAGDCHDVTCCPAPYTLALDRTLSSRLVLGVYQQKRRGSPRTEKARQWIYGG